MLLNSYALEIAISLIFIYFLGSVIVSHINELAAGIFQFRAKQLEEAIGQMLVDKAFTDQLMSNSIMNSLFSAQSKSGKRGFPSYIPTNTFALALLRQAFPNGIPTAVEELKVQINQIPSPSLRELLMGLVNQGVTDANQLTKKVEEWYDQKMERASGVYKRKVQWFILLWAVLIVVLLNLDTLSIMKSLSSNDALREGIANKAITISAPATSGSADSAASIEQTKSALDNLGLAIGWSPFIKANATFGDWVSKVMGLLITVGAVSLGAPFWFDILNKVSNLRSTVTPPKQQPEPAPTTPAAPPAASAPANFLAVPSPFPATTLPTQVTVTNQPTIINEVPGQNADEPAAEAPPVDAPPPEVEVTPAAPSTQG